MGWSKGTWRRSSMRVRARVSISALMDAGFLVECVRRHGDAGAHSFHEKTQPVATPMARRVAVNGQEHAICNRAPLCLYFPPGALYASFRGKGCAQDIRATPHFYDSPP
ncbi:hypothetical protein GCM10008969_48420 [Pseudomonas veronii subsp. inensis]